MIWNEKFYKIRNCRGYALITIPKSVLALAGFKPGDHIWFSVQKGAITIRKVEWKHDRSKGDRDKQD